jgi:hypothetical protein
LDFEFHFNLEHDAQTSPVRISEMVGILGELWRIARAAKAKRKSDEMSKEVAAAGFKTRTMVAP